jgi:hypothetical protein
MKNPFDKHNFAKQPDYHSNSAKIKARQQLIHAYAKITGVNVLPKEKSYWTFCNKQPNTEGAEIVQLTQSGFITKSQFFGIDNDIKKEGVIEFNKKQHPEANWLCGDWLEVIEENFESFNPALVYFDYTKTVVKTGCHMYLAKTMNLCPPQTVVAANLMLSDGHSSKRFDSKILVESVGKYLRDPQEWVVSEQFYSYKASQTDMGTFFFHKSTI